MKSTSVKRVIAGLSALSVSLMLAGCGGGASDAGSSASAPSGGTVNEDGSFTLETINIIVDGTVTATVDAGQAEFVAQWEAAVGE